MGPVRSVWPGHGYSLIELMFAIGLLAILAGVAIPRSLGALDVLRARGAARYLSARLQQARMEAVIRNASTALRFEKAGDAFAFTPYVDGNRNGVRSADIERGLDRPLRRAERLRDQFPGVDFGALPDLPAVDPSSPPPGADPVRIGASDMISFSPEGTATPGSLYLRGRGGVQLAVRVYGETGRTRVLGFDVRSRTWKPL